MIKRLTLFLSALIACSLAMPASAIIVSSRPMIVSRPMVVSRPISTPVYRPAPAPVYRPSVPITRTAPRPVARPVSQSYSTVHHTTAPVWWYLVAAQMGAHSQAKEQSFYAKCRRTEPKDRSEACKRALRDW